MFRREPGAQRPLIINVLIVEGGSARPRTFSGEEATVRGLPAAEPVRVSARVSFLDPGTVEIHRVLYHKICLRDGALYIGVAVVFLVWLHKKGQR